MTGEPLRIAMWSGPRNISTAMMRAWENRPDTTVIDEPFYAHYLTATGSDHPGRDEVIAAYEADWRKIVDHLTGPVPGGKPVFYQKHMTHHMLPEMDEAWLDGLANVFLIRDPRAVIASYVKKRGTATADDIGIARQKELFETVRRPQRKVAAGDRFRPHPRRSRRRAGPALRAAGPRLRRAHAVLARRPAPDRRRLGEILVPRGGALDRLPTAGGRRS